MPFVCLKSRELVHSAMRSLNYAGTTLNTRSGDFTLTVCSWETTYVSCACQRTNVGFASSQPSATQFPNKTWFGISPCSSAWIGQRVKRETRYASWFFSPDSPQCIIEKYLRKFPAPIILTYTFTSCIIFYARKFKLFIY